MSNGETVQTAQLDVRALDDAGQRMTRDPLARAKLDTAAGGVAAQDILPSLAERVDLQGCDFQIRGGRYATSHRQSLD